MIHLLFNQLNQTNYLMTIEQHIIMDEYNTGQCVIDIAINHIIIYLAYFMNIKCDKNLTDGVAHKYVIDIVIWPICALYHTANRGMTL